MRGGRGRRSQAFLWHRLIGGENDRLEPVAQKVLDGLPEGGNPLLVIRLNADPVTSDRQHRYGSVMISSIKPKSPCTMGRDRGIQISTA